jgi:hypothetical protein
MPSKKRKAKRALPQPTEEELDPEYVVVTKEDVP